MTFVKRYEKTIIETKKKRVNRENVKHIKEYFILFKL